MNFLIPNYDSSWNSCFEQLAQELEQVDSSLAALENRVIYPSKENIFSAFRLCRFSDVKVVIVGQDPYHGEGEAVGLSFSVPSGVRLPPSLRNIYKERESDLGIPVSENGDLSSWAAQGVLLLNSMLTVEADCAGSHGKIGWEQITDGVIRHLSANRDGIIFVLWGKFAEKKRSLIDESRHSVLISAHPSPLSAHRGFFGSRPFSAINQILTNTGNEIIDWRTE